MDGRAGLTLTEAARWLGLTIPCVHALIARGELTSLRDPDGSIQVSAAALIEWAGKAAVTLRAARDDLLELTVGAGTLRAARSAVDVPAAHRRTRGAQRCTASSSAPRSRHAVSRDGPPGCRVPELGHGV
jgi:hypothetical protein